MNPPRERHIQATWENFLRLVIPANASDVQITEMRNAYFAGASELMRLVLTRLEPGSDATENDMLFMEDLSNEIEEFADEKLAEIQGTH